MIQWGSSAWRFNLKLYTGIEGPAYDSVNGCRRPNLIIVYGCKWRTIYIKYTCITYSWITFLICQTQMRFDFNSIYKIRGSHFVYFFAFEKYTIFTCKANKTFNQEILNRKIALHKPYTTLRTFKIQRICFFEEKWLDNTCHFNLFTTRCHRCIPIYWQLFSHWRPRAYILITWNGHVLHGLCQGRIPGVRFDLLSYTLVSTYSQFRLNFRAVSCLRFGFFKHI